MEMAFACAHPRGHIGGGAVCIVFAFKPGRCLNLAVLEVVAVLQVSGTHSLEQCPLQALKMLQLVTSYCWKDQAVCKQPLRACPINLWTLCCTMIIVSRHSCNCYQTHGQVMKAVIS